MIPDLAPTAWEQGDPYERYIGRWSRRVAPRFLSWLAPPGGRRWLDVGCGTGALTAAILDLCAPASVAGVEPSDGFRTAARKRLPDHVALHRGDAMGLPLADASVDIVVSGLVLNFVSDPVAGLAEMARVAVPGGTIGVYLWDYARGMELVRFFWDAAVALDASAGELDEGTRFPICNAAPLRELFLSAGLSGVEVTAIDIATRFSAFDDYWEPFLGGQGPAPSYAMSLGDVARARLRERLRERLPSAADGSITMTARAWASRGIVAQERVARNAPKDE